MNTGLCYRNWKKREDIEILGLDEKKILTDILKKPVESGLI